MKRIRDKKSIVFKLTSFVILIIIVQAILLTGTLIAGGVLSQGKENAYNSFYKKVNNRKDYIQREMKNRWTNMDPYVTQISKRLSESKGNDAFFKGAIKDLISMLRTTETTGVFIILDEGKSLEEEHSAIYLRDYDALLNDSSNKDLYLKIGPAELAKEARMPLDEEWKYGIKLEKGNRDFYEKPYKKASLTSDANLLGYWSTPFSLYPKDIQVITYSMPIFDSDHHFRGVIGVEISLDYLTKLLPATDLQQRDSLGYLIGFKGKDDDGIHPIIMNGAFQNRMIRSDEALEIESIDSRKNIYLIKNSNIKEKIYASVEKIGLYYNNTPFQEEQWYLIGMMTEDSLLSYVVKIQHLLWISFAFSIFIGIIGGYFISYRFTKPIIKLAKQVRESDKNEAIKLKATGLSEVDELSSAMEYANNALLESTVKMSRIIDLVGVPIGAFEYSDDTERVFVTDQLQCILAIEKEEAREILQNKSLFIEKIIDILSRPEPDEEKVYKLKNNVEKWVKIKAVINENSTLGIVIDVTEEILEKKKIKRDRDLDPLTKIFNRKAFQARTESILNSGENLGTTALLMLDLDNLKTNNDTYGHKWGDIYINSAVDQLKKFDRSHRVLGRRSGDEFILFLYGYPSKDSIRALIEDFYEKLKKEPLTLPDGKVQPITISSGLTWIENPKLTYDELLHEADEALYKAKKFYKGTCYERE